MPEKKLKEPDESENKNSSNSENSATNQPDSKDTNNQPIDQAVDDIVRKESDEVMAAEDGKQLASPKQTWYKKILADKRLSIPLGVIVLVLILLAVPITRYKALGLFLKQTYKLELLDNQTAQPISAATISIAGQTVQTDGQGKANPKVRLGSATIVVTKKYYQGLNQKIMIGLRSGPLHIYKIQAIGRPLTFKVVNKITNTPIVNAELSAAGTTAKSDNNGVLSIVLPADKNSVDATLSANGYNAATTNIQIVNGKVSSNTLNLVPTGKLYFLSNASGKIDVVSTNLDGTDRQTILAGTGNENATSTSLLASRDWKYLALQSKRDTTGNDQLNLIDTSNNQIINIDKGNARFTPAGWSGDNFVYLVSRNGLQPWDSNQQAIKSFNAVSKKTTILTQTAASGTSAFNFVYQSIGDVYLIGSQVAYSINWYSSSGDQEGQIDSNPATLNTINPDGSNNKVVKNFKLVSGVALSSVNINTTPYNAANSFAIDFFDGQQDNYYLYQNGQVSQSSNLNEQTFNNLYGSSNNYLQSPNGNQTFWSEPRDGKNTLFVGDQNGNNGKQIATLSDYVAYGWYTDNYLLVEKNGSELYIMPTNAGSALKVSDYYKPAQNFKGYGGGYGGQ